MIDRKANFTSVTWMGGTYTSSDLLYYDQEVAIIEGKGSVAFKLFQYTDGRFYKAMIAVDGSAFDDDSLVAMPCPPFCDGKGDLTNYPIWFKAVTAEIIKDLGSGIGEITSPGAGTDMKKVGSKGGGKKEMKRNRH